MGRTQDALQAFSKAAEYHSTPELQFKLGTLYATLGQAPEAVNRIREAIREKPDWDEALNDLAHLLATSPDARVRNGEEAVRLARAVCERTQYQFAVPVDTLAAAYAEAGQFPAAVETAKKAAALARNAKQKTFATEIEERVKLYQAGQPFRQPH